MTIGLLTSYGGYRELNSDKDLIETTTETENGFLQNIFV